MSNEPIRKAKNVATAVKWLAIGFVVALFIYLMWTNWEYRPLRVFNKQPELPMTVWLAMAFVAGVAAGGLFFGRRRK